MLSDMVLCQSRAGLPIEPLQSSTNKMRAGLLLKVSVH